MPNGADKLLIDISTLGDISRTFIGRFNSRALRDF